jgi:hypothetical protein
MYGITKGNYTKMFIIKNIPNFTRYFKLTFEINLLPLVIIAIAKNIAKGKASINPK